MVSERLKLEYWTVNLKQIIYFTFRFGRSFAINSRIFTQKMIKRYSRITHLDRTESSKLRRNKIWNTPTKF